MAATITAASRYSSFDSRSSTASSTEFKPKSPAPLPSSSSSSRALVKSKAKASDLSHANNYNFTDLVKKFMGKKSSSAAKGKFGAGNLVIPADLIAEDLKKTAKKANKSNQLGALPKKLLGVADKKKKEKENVKALMDVKNGGNNANARTLAMVLRSERELLSANKEMETQIAELKSVLEQRNREVEKLKDLCLSQREEIKTLKSAVLFPDVNNELQELLEAQGSELRQAKRLIPALQRQVTSFTGQLQCLADDLAEVKAEKYSAKACFQHQISSSPKTPIYHHEEASNSLEFSSSEATGPGSPDELFLKDVNPCLTPGYAKSKSKEFEENDRFHECDLSPCSRNLSRSTDYCREDNSGGRIVHAGHRSDGSKFTYRKPMRQNLFLR